MKPILGLPQAIAVALLLAGPALADQVVPSDQVVSRVIVRAEADGSSERVGSLPPGDSAQLLEDVPNFYKVKLASGVVGFVSKRWTELHVVQPTTAATTSERQMTAHIIDLLQGNSALLEFPCAAVLIDAGGQNADTTEKLITYLSAFFDRRSDLHKELAVVFVTHTHVDHNKALRKVVETFNVKGYVHNGAYNGSGRAGAQWMRDHANEGGRSIVQRSVSDSEITALPSKSGLTDGTIDPVQCSPVDPKIEVLSGAMEEDPGWSPGEFANQNNHSLVIRVDFGEASFLFTGDLEEPAIETMVDWYAGTPQLDVDVYHVGHHGSYNGSTISLLRAMSPGVAVISVGPSSDQRAWTAWQYGHPRKSAIDMFVHEISGSRPMKVVDVATAVKTFDRESMTKAIYATGWDGNIDIVADTDGAIFVSTER